MVIRTIAAAGLIMSALCAPLAAAADLALLEWGEFNVDAESAIKPVKVDLVAGGRELKLSMSLDKLVATADGGKTEGASSFSGHFLVLQPDYISLPSAVIELQGHIVKTPGSTARIDVTIGSDKKTLEWGADDSRAEAFTTTITTVIADGQLPSPFPISASAFVAKDKGGGAVLVSLERINITIGQIQVANAPQ
jgi:hypothetical protein